LIHRNYPFIYIQNGKGQNVPRDRDYLKKESGAFAPPGQSGCFILEELKALPQLLQSFRHGAVSAKPKFICDLCMSLALLTQLNYPIVGRPLDTSCRQYITKSRTKELPEKVLYTIG